MWGRLPGACASPVPAAAGRGPSRGLMRLAAAHCQACGVDPLATATSRTRPTSTGVGLSTTPTRSRASRSRLILNNPSGRAPAHVARGRHEPLRRVHECVCGIVPVPLPIPSVSWKCLSIRRKYHRHRHSCYISTSRVNRYLFAHGLPCFRFCFSIVRRIAVASWLLGDQGASVCSLSAYVKAFARSCAWA